jgi:hypothetical protein
MIKRILLIMACLCMFTSCMMLDVNIPTSSERDDRVIVFTVLYEIPNNANIETLIEEFLDRNVGYISDGIIMYEVYEMGDGIVLEDDVPEMEGNTDEITEVYDEDAIRI